MPLIIDCLITRLLPELKMNTFNQSLTGSIREQNQDFILADEKLRFCVVVDGHGIDGKTIAETVAKSIFQRIKDIAPVTSAEESLCRLQEAISLVGLSNLKGGFEISVFWANRGIVSTICTGRCKIFFEESDCFILQSKQAESRNIMPDQALLLVSEGFCHAFENSDSQAVMQQMCKVSDNTEFEQVFELLATGYDGDDISAILIRFDKTDVTAGCPRELVLSEHFDKQYSCRLLDIFSILGLGVLIAIIGKLLRKR